MKIKTISFLLLLLMASMIPTTTGQLNPIAISGFVYLEDASPASNAEVTVFNVNTVFYANTTTDVNGQYVTTMSGSDGDMIRVNCSHLGEAGVNNTTVDLSDPTQWRNLSLSPSAIPPDALFTYNQYNLEGTITIYGQTVFFHDYSTDIDGTIILWHWDFNDGHTTLGKRPHHTYEEDGKYRVTLTVTDNDGLTDDMSKTITVETGVRGDNVSIPKPMPPLYPGFTVPEMYSLLKVSDLSNSDSKIVVVFLDSGVYPRNYSGIDLAAIESYHHPSYISGIDANGHGCVSGDSYLYLENGLIKIKDFYENLDAEMVETTAGMTKYINAKTMSISEEGMTQIDDIYASHKVKVDEAIEITTLWNKTLLLTPWHPTPTVTSSGIVWKRADEITCDDYIASPIKTEDFGEYQNIEYFKKDKRGQSKKYTAMLDEDLAWLIGFTIGDGTVYPTTNQVMLHDEKLSTLQKAKEIVEKRGFSVGKGIRDNKRQNSYILNIYYGFDKLFVAIGYDNVVKNIPDIIFRSSNSVKASFVAGLFDAEGYCWENSKGERQRYGLGEIRVIVSTNEELCKGLVVILDSLGLPSSYEVTLKEGYGGMKNNHTLYAVTLKQKWNLINFLAKTEEYIVTFKKDVIRRNIASNPVYKREVVFFGDYVGLKVRKIESKKDIDEWFYDLSTKKNNNYYASGFMVHNTFVSYELAYILQTKLPNSVLISYKIFGRNGECSPEIFLEALETIKKFNPDVISISAGAFGHPDDAFSRKVKELRDSGIIVVVASGNLGPTPSTILSPACSDSAIAIAASNPRWADDYEERQKIILDLSDDTICPWSSRGPVLELFKPDCTSPGESIIGPWLNGERVSSGTSMSTPLIAGGAATVLANNKGLADIVKTIYFWDGGIIANVFEDSLKEGCYKKGAIDDWGAGIPVFTDVNSIFFWKLVLLILILIIIIVVIVTVSIVAYWYYKKKRKPKTTSVKKKKQKKM